jgi:predicted flap endonuclease-1-like 5' DNA nuclease
MKRVYWFLPVFVVWCIGCAIWYMFSVKGLSADPNYFAPHPRLIAILEILIMVLVACLIGYFIGWILRGDTVNILKDTVQRMEMDNEALVSLKQELEHKVDMTRQGLRDTQQNFNHNLSQSNETNELLRKELTELNHELIRLKETQINQPISSQLENELGALRFKAKQLEFQKQELEEANEKLKKDLESKVLLSKSSTVEPLHPFVRPLEMNEKDDLTRIKGIGPFIEKRLNMLGIYTFRQISEFTPETVEHISKAIEFFPKRIVRDNWVGQAKELCS